MMRFYNQSHQFYGGVDLHARSLYLCVLDHAGAIVCQQNLDARPGAFLAAIEGVSEELTVEVAEDKGDLGRP